MKYQNILMKGFMMSAIIMLSACSSLQETPEQSNSENKAIAGLNKTMTAMGDGIKEGFNKTLATISKPFNSATNRQAKASSYEAVVSSSDGSEISYGVIDKIGQPKNNLTLVFIHCWTCDHSLWQAQLEHFSQYYRVVWVDLAGHGQSKSKRENYTMEAFAQDVAAVVNEVDANKVVLIGHSMGGPVALETAKLLDDKLVGIVAADSFYTPFEYPKSEAEIEKFVAVFKQDFHAATNTLVESMFVENADETKKQEIIALFKQNDETMGLSAFYGIFHWEMNKGEQSRAMFSDKLRNINAKNGSEHPSVYEIENVGHFVPQMKAAEFNQVLQIYLHEFSRKQMSSSLKENDSKCPVF